jgi:biotin carboxyl carrier protein
MDVERLRLWMLERQVVITTDKEELKRQEERQKLVHKLQQEGVVNTWEAMMIDMRVAVLKTEIAESEKAVVEAQRQIEAAMERMFITDVDLALHATSQPQPTTRPGALTASVPTVATQPASLHEYAQRTKPDMDKLLGPARAAIAEQKARLEEIQLQLELLEIKAPLGGMVTAIFRWPGQTVRNGDAIMTIANPDTQQVIGYVRQEVPVQPKVGMMVEVRRRSAPIIAAEARIERVGPQFMPVPPHHLRDPRLLEWGVPVSIVVPAGLKLVPGELVDIALRPAG